MQRRPWLFVACVWMAGCSGAELEGRLADRVETELTPTTVRAGETAGVTCHVFTARGREIETPTAFGFEPGEGVTADEDGLTPTIAGTVTVRCEATDYGLKDDVGAELTIVAGAPAKVTTILTDPTVQVHQATTAECVVEDAWGNVVTDAETSVGGDEGLIADGHEVSSETPGSYEVRCAVAGADEVEVVPATLEVTAGDPATVELVAKPALVRYEVEENVTISWIVRDAWGNEIPDLPGTLTAPTPGVFEVNAETHVYQFVEEGLHTWTVQLDAPWDGLTDDLTLVCDETGPEIVITWPERGATLQGDGEPIVIEGTIVDAFGEVSFFEINGETVPVGADGSFTAEMLPVWGLNVIVAEARDGFNNDSKLTPTFHYSPAYVDFVDQDAQGVLQTDGLELLLGQAFLDDGDHDLAHPNDLATLLELVLGQLDLTQLIGAGNGPLFSQEIPIPNLPNIDLGLFQAQAEGAITIEASIVEPTATGPLGVTINSREGGIDTFVTIGDPTKPGFQVTVQISIVAELVLSWEVLGFPGQAVAYASATPKSGLSIDAIILGLAIDMAMPPGGQLDIEMKDLELELQGLGIDPIQDVTFVFGFTGLPLIGDFELDFDLSQFIDLNALTDQLLDPLTQNLLPSLLDAVEPVIASVVGPALEQAFQLLQIELPIPLPQLFGPQQQAAELELYTALSSVTWEEDGGQLGMSLGFWSEKGVEREPLGAIQREGCMLGAPADFDYDWDKSVGMALKTDAVNSLLFAIWWSGWLNGPLDLGALGLGGGAGGLPIDDVALDLNWLLPPVMNDCSKAETIEIQIGDLFADVNLSLLAIDVDAKIYADVGIQIAFVGKPDGLYIQLLGLSFIDVEVVEVEEVLSDLFDIKSLLEDSLGDIIGGFVDGQELGPIALPAIPIDGLLPGIPPGTALELGDLGISTDQGYLVIGGNLK